MAQAMEKAAIAEARAVNALTLGKGLIRFGGVTSALSGVAEGAQYFFAAYRNSRAGDAPALIRHVIAGGFAVGSGFAAGVAAYYGLSSLMGPLGLAIAFGLVAYAASRSAKDRESTPLEQWCRRCYFGAHNENPSVWWNSAKTDIYVPKPRNLEDAIAKSNAANKDKQIAIGALNSAILGMGIAAEFLNNPRPTLDIRSVEPIWSQAFVYRIDFPQWDNQQSAYAMYVSLKNYKGEHVAVAEQHNAPPLAQLSSPQQRPSYTVDADATRNPTELESTVAGTLNLAFLERDIESATVRAKYWPNKAETDLYAELELTILR